LTTIREKHNGNAPPVIVGAGPAGLAAAYTLTQAREQPVIFESRATPGGLARTEVYRGFRADIGGHRFFTKNERVFQLWSELLGEDFIERPRLSRIYYHKTFFPYPLNVKTTLKQLGPTEIIQILLSYARAKVNPIKPVETFEEWVVNRFGRRLYEHFFKTYTEKVWGIPCHTISSEWASQRIKDLSVREALRNALLRRNDNNVTSLIESFHYPRLGPGMMWQAFAERIEASGGHLFYQHRVGRIHHRDSRVVAVRVNTAAGPETRDVSSVISSMPLSELVQSLDPQPPSEVLQASRALNYRDFITVNLIIDHPDLFPDNWIYVHDPEVKLGRIQNYKNWSPDMVPNSHQTALGLEYFVFQSDPEWTRPDSDLLEMGIREVARLGLVDPETVVDGWVVRVPKTYPIYDAGYPNAVATIRSYLESFDNLQTIGRNGLHRYNNMDHSMLTGITAAQNILEGAEHDIWSINADDHYHEELVVDDETDAVIDELLTPLHAPSLSLAVGGVVALYSLGLSLVPLLDPDPFLNRSFSLLSQFFVGYSVSWFGALVLAVEAFVVGSVFGYLMARLRNTMLRRWVEEAGKQTSWRKLFTFYTDR
jgi:protoporphyrinogen oxidase